MSRSRPALPYRVLTPSSVQPSALGWAVFVGNEILNHVSDGEALLDWDALLEFKLEREFVLRSDPYRELDLKGHDAQIELVVSCSTGGGSSRDVLFRKDVRPEEDQSVTVEIAPSSERLSRDLTITTGLYLKHSLRGQLPLVPSNAGAVLWEQTERIRLEGGAARLPIYVVSFPQVFAGEGIDDAEFHVEVAAELDLELETCLTVYVNTERADFVAQLGQRGSMAERRLWNGVVRRVLIHAIISGALEDSADAGRESLSATVRRWAGFVWPDEPTSRLRELVVDRYALCEAQIDGWLAQLDDSRRLGGGK